MINFDHDFPKANPEKLAMADLNGGSNSAYS